MTGRLQLSNSSQDIIQTQTAMKSKALSLLALAASANLASAAFTISVNLVPDNGTADDVSMPTNFTAGVAAAPGWNNAPTAGDNTNAFSLSNVFNSLGATTTADFAFAPSGATNAATFADPSDPNRRMMNGNVALNSFTVTQIPTDLTGSGYLAYVYFDDNNDSLGQGVSATVGSTTYFGDNSGNYATATTPSFVRATGTTSGNANNSNYFLFEGLSSDSLTVTFGGSTRQAITGIQLVAVPEPSTALLCILGSLALLRRRR